MSDNNLSELSSETLAHFRTQAIIAESKITEKISKALDDTETAGRRWFWELLQNAKDTVAFNPNKPEIPFKNVKDKTVDITVNYWQKDQLYFLRFEHNGNPFSYTDDPYRFDDVTNLILPVSGKDNQYQTGKFGTGFLSTHILSLKIDVQGVFLNKEGLLQDFNFVIDRTKFTTDNSNTDGRKLFIESIVDALSNSVQYAPHQNGIKSSFTYHLNSNIKNDIKWVNQLVTEGLNDLEILLPFSLCFNKTIRRVTIHNELQETTTIYELIKEERIAPEWEDLFHYTVSKNEESVNILLVNNEKTQLANYFETGSGTEHRNLVNMDERYRNKTGKSIPFLFSSFPLIGSEEFTFPVLINSKNFKPKETRDSISLKNNESGNQTIIEEASILYQKLLTSLSNASWKKTYNICNTNTTIGPTHKWISDIWYKPKVSLQLRASILKEKLVDIPPEKESKKWLRKAIKGNEDVVHFPINNKKEALWQFARDLFPQTVPALEEITEWNKILWDNEKDIIKVNAEFLIITISQFRKDITPLAHKIFGQTETSLDDLISWLYDFAKFIYLDLKQPALFDKKDQLRPYPILPNRKKELKLLGELNYDIGYYANETIEETTLDLYLDICGKPIEGDLMDKKFDDLNLLPQARKIIEGDLAGKICETINRKIKEGKLSNADKTTFGKLRNFLFGIKNEVVHETDKAGKARQNKYEKLYADLDLDKILISVVDPDKISSITKLLESDRNGTINIKVFEQLANRPDILEIAQQLLLTEEEDNFDFSVKKEIGNIFETLFKQVMENYDFLQIKKVEGEEDFYIHNLITQKYFYIEIKSATKNRTFVDLTPDQGKAFVNKDNYILCIVPDSNLVQNESSFTAKAIFNKDLNNVLKSKVHSIEDFEAVDSGIEIFFETELLKRHKKYKYKYRIRDNIWGGGTFDHFLQWINEST